MTDVNIFIGSEFWEGLIPEEELPDLLENVLAEAIGFWAILCNKRLVYWVHFLSKKKI